MLSVATVRSAKGAAAYFAADNYYTAGEAETSGEWFGKGAETLGLSGNVDKETFEGLLKGSLPNGSQVGTAERHRAGIDLTFSMPKSWSLLALVGGDRRIIEAYREAVKETLAWAETNAAETRMEVKGREKVVATGNLIGALFEHDTSREQEPQAHLHAVVANVTQGPDGKWRALHNDKLWSLNTLFNSMTMASFRGKVEALGYAVGERSKHGNFEAEGIARNVVMAFSTRRQQILAKVAELKQRTPEALHAATLMTRSKKAPVADRDALYASWRDTAQHVGSDLPAMVAQAQEQAAGGETSWSRIAQGLERAALRGRAFAAAFAERLGAPPSDPYVPARIHLKTPDEIAAALAVASAVRHLEQREAAFARTDIYKTALDFGLPATMAAIEKSVDRLVRADVLIPGIGCDKRMMTTRQGMAAEQRILAAVEAGRGQSHGIPFMAADEAAQRLQEAAEARSGIRLNGGQEAAGRLLLSSPDRIIAIQGVAGAGKSSMLAPAADLIRAADRPVIGLAVQNTLVQMLERDTGIRSMTVAKFLRAHEKLLEPNCDAETLAQARASLGGGAMLVDEASMLSNLDQMKLVELANLLEVGRLAFIGDAKQLGAVDAGKPFALMQAAGAPTARMSENIRARGEAVKEAAAAAQHGEVGRAMVALKPFTLEAPGRGAEEAAERWLSLAPEERSRTAIYASGRRLRGMVNQAVQSGLLARGQIGPASIDLTVLDRVNLTAEELRYAQNYAVGSLVEANGGRGSRLRRGFFEVIGADARSGTLTLRDGRGREQKYRPERSQARNRDPSLQVYERKALRLHERDRIRWTATDPERGLFNADQATVAAIGGKDVTIETSQGQKLVLHASDPMLRRLDLAYALNAHMAQGLTSDAGIAVIETRDTKLVNQQTFLVTVTRLRDSLTLVVDRADGIERQLRRNLGGKTSALEVTGNSGRPAAGVRPYSERPNERLVDPEKSIDSGSRPKPYELGI
jgi:conjugative relaxase-like TrwC/TraI family protein